MKELVAHPSKYLLSKLTVINDSSSEKNDPSDNDEPKIIVKNESEKSFNYNDDHQNEETREMSRTSGFKNNNDNSSD